MYTANSSFSKNMLTAVNMICSIAFTSPVLGRTTAIRPVRPRSSSARTAGDSSAPYPSLRPAEATVLQSPSCPLPAEVPEVPGVEAAAVLHSLAVSLSQAIASTTAADGSVVAMADEAVAMADDAVAMADEAVAIAEDAVAMAEEALATAAEEMVAVAAGRAVASAVNTSSTGHISMSPEEKENFPSAHFVYCHKNNILYIIHTYCL